MYDVRTANVQTFCSFCYWHLNHFWTQYVALNRTNRIPHVCTIIINQPLSIRHGTLFTCMEKTASLVYITKTVHSIVACVTHESTAFDFLHGWCNIIYAQKSVYLINYVIMAQFYRATIIMLKEFKIYTLWTHHNITFYHVLTGPSLKFKTALSQNVLSHPWPLIHLCCFNYKHHPP